MKNADSDRSYLIRAKSLEALIDSSIEAYQLVFRRDFSAPGFALIHFEFEVTSRSIRQLMVDLKEVFSANCASDFGEGLGFFTLNRFDQQITTKPHRDGAPNRSVLILGYEPSSISSQVRIADYSKCALKLGVSPEKFLEEFNPMYEAGLEELKPFTTLIHEFDHSRFQILLINNSCEEFTPGSNKSLNWLGVLHSAEILERGSHSRVINSMGVAPISCITCQGDSNNLRSKVHDFVNNDAMNGSYA